MLKMMAVTIAFIWWKEMKMNVNIIMKLETGERVSAGRTRHPTQLNQIVVVVVVDRAYIYTSRMKTEI